MRRTLVTFVSVVCCAVNVLHAEDPDYRDLYPDTWVATDALGGPCRSFRPRAR